MSSILQNIFILLGIVLIGGLGYYLYTQNVGLDVSQQNTAVSRQVEAETAEFLMRLNELRGIQLDGAIFSDPRFTSLIETSFPVQSQPAGKTNPFGIN